ncbi:MAG: exodeoxyribonuclease VII small subunit [Rhodospirillaceae bacterium]|nr:exodeoxyribonuclease VII small subunit [Rhodospirillaceae bacterium]
MAKSPAHDAIPDDITRMGFEEAMKELEDIVRRLEGGQVKLDDAVNAYTRGSFLKRHCEAKLADAKMKVEKITQVGKALGLEPMDES